MNACLFCKRNVPFVPDTQPSAGVHVAHVDTGGEPCLEGSEPEAHAVALADYPHDELLDDPDMWDLDAPVARPSAATDTIKSKPRKNRKKQHAAE